MTHVSEVVPGGQTALCIFTRGQHFQIGQDGHGTTGKWVIDPAREPDVVILYHRQSDAVSEVYSAHCDGYAGPDEEGRFTLSLIDLVLCGTTPTNWREFCDTWSNPIRYWSAAA